MSSPFHDPPKSRILRIVSAVLSVFLATYGAVRMMDARTIIGIDSKSHGLIIAAIGLWMARYAIEGRTGLPILDDE